MFTQNILCYSIFTGKQIIAPSKMFTQIILCYSIFTGKQIIIILLFLYFVAQVHPMKFWKEIVLKVLQVSNKALKDNFPVYKITSYMPATYRNEFSSRESSIVIVNSHTNCSENILWQKNRDFVRTYGQNS